MTPVSSMGSVTLLLDDVQRFSEELESFFGPRHHGEMGSRKALMGALFGLFSWMPLNAFSAANLSAGDVFSKAVYDGGRSPTQDELFIVSAKGVYRSFGGEKWEKLAIFADANLPVAFAPNGHLFVGPFRSTDNGKTFDSYIKWDENMRALRRETSRSPRKIQILKVLVEDENGKKLRLLVDFGWEQPAILRTADGGRTWHHEGDQKLESWIAGLDSLDSLGRRTSDPLSNVAAGSLPARSVTKPPSSPTKSSAALSHPVPQAPPAPPALAH